MKKHKTTIKVKRLGKVDNFGVLNLIGIDMNIKNERPRAQGRNISKKGRQTEN